MLEVYAMNPSWNPADLSGRHVKREPVVSLQYYSKYLWGEWLLLRPARDGNTARMRPFASCGEFF